MKSCVWEGVYRARRFWRCCCCSSRARSAEARPSASRIQRSMCTWRSTSLSHACLARALRTSRLAALMPPWARARSISLGSPARARRGLAAVPAQEGPEGAQIRVLRCAGVLGRRAGEPGGRLNAHSQLVEVGIGCDETRCHASADIDGSSGFRGPELRRRGERSARASTAPPLGALDRPGIPPGCSCSADGPL
jgi:hypothetical protein